MPFQPYDAERAGLLHRRKVAALSLVGLAAYLLFQAVLVRSWLAKDTRPPAWDESVQLETALDARESLARGDWGAVLRPQPKPGMPAFPPAYHLALQPAMHSTRPEAAAIWINFAYYALLLVAVFGIVFHFRADYGAAAAAIAFAAAPGVQELLFTQLIDLPLTACSAAAFWAFLESDEFARLGPSALFGALFGAGMLHKWSFFAYMIPAYVSALRALSRRGPKLPVVLAVSVAAALSVPWYALNWPLLLPRLVQASSDFAIPVWQGTASLTYLWASLAAFGPLFWVMAWLGLIVPRYRRNAEHGWLVPFWVVSSYVFWAIVPNRQMRFLLPGLPALAVLASGSWPNAMVGALLAFQVFGAANWARGFLGPVVVPLPGANAALFANDPARAEDWRIDEILQTAERRSDPSEPVADVSLVANARRFNGPLFSWRRRRLGLQRVRMRGVNKRLCEFSQFVVLKNGELGPSSVIGGLPEAAQLIRSSDKWFARGYEQVGRWPLPDGSDAVLYQRAKLDKAPFSAKGVVTFQYYNWGALNAVNLNIDLGKFDAAAGVYPRAKLGTGSAEVRGLRLADLGAEFEDLAVIPAGDRGDRDEWADVRFLKLKRLRVTSLRVEAADLKTFLQARVKGLQLSTLTIDKTVKAAGAFRSIPVSLELSLAKKADPARLEIRAVSVSVAGFPLPVGALNRIKELTVPLEPNPETPFWIELPGLTLQGDRLTVP